MRGDERPNRLLSRLDRRGGYALPGWYPPSGNERHPARRPRVTAVNNRVTSRVPLRIGTPSSCLRVARRLLVDA